jgi:hypothetical protein
MRFARAQTKSDQHKPGKIGFPRGSQNLPNGKLAGIFIPSVPDRPSARGSQVWRVGLEPARIPFDVLVEKYGFIGHKDPGSNKVDR